MPHLVSANTNRPLRKIGLQNPEIILAQLNDEVGLRLVRNFLIGESARISSELKKAQRYASSSRTIWKGPLPIRKRDQQFRVKESPRRMYWRTKEMKDTSNILMELSYRYKNRSYRHESDSIVSLKQQILSSIRAIDSVKVFTRRKGASKGFVWTFLYGLRSTAISDWSGAFYGELQESGFKHVRSGKRVKASRWLTRSIDQITLGQ